MEERSSNLALTPAQFLDPIYDAFSKAKMPRSFDGYIHPSSLMDCPMTWYNWIHGLKVKVPSPAAALLFCHGDAIHKEFQEVLGTHGNLVAKEYRITYEKYRLCGHVDAISHYPGHGLIAWDIKSIDQDQFREMPEDEVRIEDELQLMFYLWMLRNSPESAFRVQPYGFILYFNRTYSIITVRRVVIRLDVINAVLDKVVYFIKNCLDDEGGVPEKYLHCGRAKTCGNCRANKKLLKEKANGSV